MQNCRVNIYIYTATISFSKKMPVTEQPKNKKLQFYQIGRVFQLTTTSAINESSLLKSSSIEWKEQYQGAIGVRDSKIILPDYLGKITIEWDLASSPKYEYEDGVWNEAQKKFSLDRSWLFRDFAIEFESQKILENFQNVLVFKSSDDNPAQQSVAVTMPEIPPHRALEPHVPPYHANRNCNCRCILCPEDCGCCVDIFEVCCCSSGECCCCICDCISGIAECTCDCIRYVHQDRSLQDSIPDPGNFRVRTGQEKIYQD